MNLFEITIQRGAEGQWPVVVEQTAAGSFLPVRTEGTLPLDLAEFKTQLAGQVFPLDYGTLLGQALFHDGTRDAFVQALAHSDGQMHVLLFVAAEDLRGLRWERLCAPWTAAGNSCRWTSVFPSAWFPIYKHKRKPSSSPT
jgi:hypothetical protein